MSRTVIQLPRGRLLPKEEPDSSLSTMWDPAAGPYVRFMSNSLRAEVRASASAPAVMLRDVRKVYGRGEGAAVALDGVSAALSPGSFTAIMGRYSSASGRSRCCARWPRRPARSGA